MPSKDIQDRVKQYLRFVEQVREAQEGLDLSREILRRQKERLEEIAPGFDSMTEPLIPVDEEAQFIELVKLWRLEHPEPPKPRQYPRGITQHESDPDSD